ncbi:MULTISPECIES: DUF998 domain-containing protein [unclassified Arthrobacter]|uniref:DUF998 domain-containing protein n=1 Tax=unclassified Arthrobacter TaxID=235627 RepID=UPI002DF9412B|nr:MULTISPECIES: DUF998 domain-containing protein [unclassified Arthrobacter]MEC5191452.1 hypothetical protein [Arthrobacter sp. MP_M4]MEC5203035.1 hypothetical protein [Arthrobacter sp. MP_M7]
MSSSASGAQPPAMDPAGSRRGVRALLVCGIVSSLLWPVTSEVLAALLYKDYSSFAQTISELTSIGAPTRTALIVEGFFYEGLIIAFGIGVWQSARGKTALRVTGSLFIAYGAVGPLWLPFPMTARVDIMPTAAFAVTDVMHLILGAVDALLYVAILGFGAAALGKGFRVYSILTLVVVLVFGAWTNSFVPLVAAGQPTPWLGVVERVMIGAFLLWVVVLALLLLRRSSQSPGHPEPGQAPPKPVRHGLAESG